VIAEQNISGKTRARIAEILGNERIEEASNWPDEQRANQDDWWQNVSPAFHLLNVPENVEARTLSHPSQGDALTGLADFVATLRNLDAPLAERQKALRFVVHIVEDLHQPLHVRRGTDNHGLNFAVSYRQPPSTSALLTNLHLIWDLQIIDDRSLSASEYAARLSGRLTPEISVAWWTADPYVWIDESVSLYEEIYPATGGQRGMGTPDSPAVVGPDYALKWRPIIEERLTQAGIRLAAYLDWVFAGT
jgi:hypothetical protein